MAMETYDFAEVYTHAPEIEAPVALDKNTLASMEVVPTGKAIGAEIRGVDLSIPVPEDVADAMRQAWTDHLVLLIRNQRLEPENYMDAARVFGEPQEGANKKY